MVMMLLDQHKATDSESASRSCASQFVLIDFRYNTWVGDSARCILFKAIVDEIERLGLVQHTAEMGEYVFSKLEELQSKYPGEIESLRGKGKGTFIAWDSPRRDEFLKQMRAQGVHVGGCTYLDENTLSCVQDITLIAVRLCCRRRASCTIATDAHLSTETCRYSAKGYGKCLRRRKE